MTGFIPFIRENARFLAAGALLTLISSFGQTFFISIFAGQIKSEFGLTDGGWGTIYMVGTLASAAVMLRAGMLTDVMRVRHLGALVMVGLAAACVFMAVNPWVYALPLVVFTLRFTGQGMLTHLAVVAMARWYVATRGRAIALSFLGYAAGEAVLPMIVVAIMDGVYWRFIWIGCAFVAFGLIPLLLQLLKQERTPQSVAHENQSFGMRGVHWSRPDCMRHYLFWFMVPVVLAPSTFVTSLFFHQVHLAEIKGYSHAGFVALFPVYTVVSVTFGVVFGWLIDKFGTARLMPWFQVPMAIGFVVLGLTNSLGATALAFVLMGLTQGGNATLSGAFWAEFYGTRHLGAIKAMATAVMVLGSAIGPAVTGGLIDAGIMFDQQMIWIAGIILTVCALIGAGISRANREFLPGL